MSQAEAETICGSRQSFIDNLGRKYAERPTAIGLLSNGSVLEVLVSESGSFSFLTTRPNGTTCMVASGEGWENIVIEKGPKT